ncbi:MAG: hypothetical protein EOO17_03790 [Chloroflexi bacterium]|nr:MAG: hypothetical protein EOO17_03790 [Chloroflexota bacterium]
MKVFRKNKKQLITWRHWAVVAILMALMVVLAVFVYVADRGSARPVAPVASANSSDTEPVTIGGEIVCLPHKGNGPSTQECAIGLRDNDGYFYGLKNSSFYETGTKVNVTGVVQDVPEANTYDIVGIIAITDTSKVQ